MLDVSRNELIELPSSFGRLNCLEEFYATKNEIRKLKESFASRLVSLRTLNLDHNSISTLPHCFTQLKALEYCDLSYNNLSELPPAIGRMEMLDTIHLRKNLLSWRSIPMGPQGTLHASSAPP